MADCRRNRNGENRPKLDLSENRKSGLKLRIETCPNDQEQILKCSLNVLSRC